MSTPTSSSWELPRRRHQLSLRCSLRALGRPPGVLSPPRRLEYDAGDVPVYSGDTARSVKQIEEAVFKIASSGAVPIVLGGDHSIAWPDHTGVARHFGFGKVSMIHFDAHADTADIQFGSLVAHGTPMRRLIESGALRGDRFLQVGLRVLLARPLRAASSS
ncbi:arginase family protein [Streptomyces sp. NPDC005303]|uniref:arginase family protein n=1 Tax=Streptomyces sp. NPDC005303 TaxID=3155713 RepID=UPI0033A6BC53